MIEVNKRKTEIVTAFLNSLIKIRGIESVLVLNHAEHELFASISCKKLDEYKHVDGIPKNGQWDLIIADLPINMPVQFNGRRSTYMAKTLVDTIDLISSNGLIFSMAEPLLLRNDVKGLRSLLNNKASISAIIDSPDGMLKPCLLYTSPSPRDRTRSRMPSSA